MRDQRDAFFAALLGRSSAYHSLASLTLTALHPDGNRPTPSRHIRLGDAVALHETLDRLDAANRQGWGAYFAVGWRKTGLSRWRRGGAEEVVALPALFIDVDDLSPNALARLKNFPIAPSCIVHSGGGYHAYWWLDEPTTDLVSTRLILRGLAASVGGDSLSVAQSLRVIGSINTKSSRSGAVCHLIHLSQRRYPFADFSGLLPKPQRVRPSSPFVLNPTSMAHLSDTLLRQGFKRRGDWLNGACPYPERHKHADHHPSFGFNTRTGYGYCHVCGSMLLKDLCALLHL
jgi:hypothetical protein